MLYLVICIAIIILDILTKLWAITGLKPISTIPLWEGVFNLTYVENRGAAFGIFQDGRWFFIVATVIILALVLHTAFRFKGKSRILSFGLSFVTAGAVGNLIDRIFRGFVVDFLDFRLIQFPVFNVADIFVCVGMGLVALFIIFFEEGKKDCEKDEI